MKDFDIEKLERKDIYKVADHLFENIQENVINDLKINRKAPIFKLNWAYTAAASLALIFGIGYMYDSISDSEKNPDSSAAHQVNNSVLKAESEIVYETLKADLTSVDDNNQIIGYQNVKITPKKSEKIKTKTTSETSVSKKTETQMTEYLDSFSSSEISELANNSTQDVYLDLYN